MEPEKKIKDLKAKHKKGVISKAEVLARIDIEVSKINRVGIINSRIRGTNFYGKSANDYFANASL
jgi:hypothetical protein